MTERIVIEQDTVHLADGHGGEHTTSLALWLRRITDDRLRGLMSEPLADHAKWHVKCGAFEIVIVQLDPALRVLQWIADESPIPFGPEATARPRRLATPYVVLKVPFRRKRIQHRVEVFYRSEPLTSLQGPGGRLYWPNLLNVSPHAHGCLSWFCTQYLEQEGPLRGITAGLNVVTHHLWGGQFNFSSEAHEGSSCFSKARTEGLDPRVTDVDRWEAASLEDPRFVLTVDWAPTGLDVHSLVLSELSAQGLEPYPNSLPHLANQVLRSQRGTPGGCDED